MRGLKAYGFSAFKAAEITLDAARGDKHAMMAVRVAFHDRHDRSHEYAALRAEKTKALAR